MAELEPGPVAVALPELPALWVADALGTDGAWRAGTGGLPGTAAPLSAAPDQPWLL